jgi:hypothetical protein
MIPAVNLVSGYKNIIIAQPEEVIENEMDDWHWESSWRKPG